MQVDTREEEAALIDIQIVTSIFFIISIVITIFLNLNEKDKLLYNDPFWDNKTASAILKRNRLLLFILFAVYLYVNLQQREYDRINNKDLTPDNLEIFVSVLTIIGALIILYEVFAYSGSDEASYDNPAI